MNFFEEALCNYFTKEQLEKIWTCTIGIAGAGGIGSNVAITLTRCGFKKFVLLDFDDIEASNLNRQQFFINEVGFKKVDILKKRILKINPDSEILTYKKRWSAEEENVFKNCDILIEGFDEADTKKQFVEFYQGSGKPIICGSGMAGYITDNPIPIKTIGNIIIVGNQTREVSKKNPPLSPQIMIIAAMMAEIVLNLTLNNRCLEEFDNQGNRAEQ